MTWTFTRPAEEVFGTKTTATELDPNEFHCTPTPGRAPCIKRPGSQSRMRGHAILTDIVTVHEYSDEDDKSILVRVKDVAANLYSWVTSPGRTASLVTSGIISGITGGIASAIGSVVSSVYETLVPEVCRDAISSSSIAQYSRFWWTDWDNRAWMVVKQTPNGKYVETTLIDKPSKTFACKGSTAGTRIYTSRWVVSAVERSKLEAMRPSRS